MMAMGTETRGWQMGKSLSECNGYMLDNQVACDVKFIVHSADGATVTIPAHKYMLVSRSPVFEAMLCGTQADQYQEGAGQIDIKDIEPTVFKQMLRFMYIGEAEVTAQNVLYLMTAAKKYLLESLELTCKEFLENNFNFENVCTILNHSRLVGDEILATKCQEFFKQNAQDVFHTDAFLDLTQDALKSLLESDDLEVESEVEVFQACMKWAKHQLGDSEPVTGAKLRETLGDCVHQIRFGEMTSNEFAKHVALNELSLMEERDYKLFSGLFLVGHEEPEIKDKLQTIGYNVTQRTAYMTTTFNRFKACGSDWTCWGDADAISFRVDRGITIHGICVYGSMVEATTTCTVDIQDGTTGLWHGTTNTSFIADGSNEPVVVKTCNPVDLNAGCGHTVKITLKGPQTYRGNDGQATVTANGVTFTFEKSDESHNGTDVNRGQISGVLFKKR